MTLSIPVSQINIEFGPLSRGWKERKKYELAHAFDRILAVRFEDEFGVLPLVEVDHLGVRIRNLDHLDEPQLAELARNVNVIYSQIMTAA